MEDYPNLARLLKLTLRAFGYEVEVAATKAEALDLAARSCFDLLVSDLSLPDGTGVDLLKELAPRGLTRGIAVSGRGDPEDVRLSHEAGFAAHLVKPLEPEALHAAIQRILDSPA